eukprot:scaffold10139_cov80-Attheya_sp.AAC.2
MVPYRLTINNLQGVSLLMQDLVVSLNQCNKDPNPVHTWSDVLPRACSTASGGSVSSKCIHNCIY